MVVTEPWPHLPFLTPLPAPQCGVDDVAPDSPASAPLG